MTPYTHYLIGSNGISNIMCRHEWTSTSRPTAGGKNIVDRSCSKCGRQERWLSLSRKRSALKF